jgi:2-polyprenyl-3-methyl-5-hydroxy-6-metoxy-1,4-benzoquinol methylase
MNPTIHPSLAAFPSLARICSAVLAVWPEHKKFLDVRFSGLTDDSLSFAEELAGLVVRIAGDDLPKYADSYRWVCANLLEEDLLFRRTGSYRWSSFDDAYREVYSRTDYMSRYLRGLLLSQVLWANQTNAFHFYVQRFLTRLKAGTDYLEVGPGHGLLMYFATRSPHIGSMTGWDVSESSLDMTRATMQAMGASGRFKLELHNILKPPSVIKKYDAVVVSEVLEHLDQPEAALATVFQALKPDGLIFLNVPVNSPAPDHIYNWESPAALEEIVRQAGFELVESDAAPTTGYSLERALRQQVAVNALIIARRP